MNKYKDTYRVFKPKDKNGKYSSNLDDTYVICYKNVQIYRYNSNTLAIQFNSNKYANNKINELYTLGVLLIILQRGDDEQVYTFPENDFSKVAEVCKAKKRIKRELTNEQKEVLRQRLNNLRRK